MLRLHSSAIHTLPPQWAYLKEVVFSRSFFKKKMKNKMRAKLGG